ncbi:TOR2 binding protein [Scheffersomyces stipitis CBS 6054]|uniref:TOR2 binding protein n=1 Tax=Scheffersomyces stipitis (strain ATCC 58785 / CBS 6054 / NBRC 10063 / NRRL Y-11545) TaxID=322104 RepID=A3LU09_PICST|nr:TOR2 binding protein [Scheffersomyces stipitis CBS 6054]ABN66161.2 TOR2 binding protein [Scheffersomyces stipitis CBS 6054]
MLEPQQRLRNAVIEGNLPIARRLMSRFPELWLNVDSGHNGWSNLHYAAYNGNYLICFHLISYINNHLGSLQSQYTSLDLLTFDELTVLHLAVVNHHSQTLHYLLQEFPGRLWLNFAGGKLKQTPLHYCCIHGFTEGVNLLMDYGANWELQDVNGDTCLHLCFQYGHFECIRAIYKFVVLNYKDKEKSSAKLTEFEKMKNKKGWVGQDYSSSFDLLSQYKSLKRELFALNFDFQESIALTDISSSNSSFLNLPNRSQTSLTENKILSSPIVPVSQSSLKTTEEDPETPTTSDYPVGARAHSQSLPGSATVPEFTSTKQKSAANRSRSNTTYTYKPPNPINTNSMVVSPRTALPPNTPKVSKAPSLKSVTISPSIRNNQDVPTSPQSALSSNSSTNNSPINHSNGGGTRKKSHSFSKPSGSYQLTSMNVSASSIAAKLAFNSSRSSLETSNSPRRRPSLSISTNDVMHSSASSKSRSRSGSDERSPHHLRKTKSSGKLPSASLTPTVEKQGGSLDSSSYNNSSTSVNLESGRRANINSISFSRIR